MLDPYDLVNNRVSSHRMFDLDLALRFGAALGLGLLLGLESRAKTRR